MGLLRTEKMKLLSAALEAQEQKRLQQLTSLP
jgi:hypothetical protein